jgi:hypothetical protein
MVQLIDLFTKSWAASAYDRLADSLALAASCLAKRDPAGLRHFVRDVVDLIGDLDAVLQEWVPTLADGDDSPLPSPVYIAAMRCVLQHDRCDQAQCPQSSWFPTVTCTTHVLTGSFGLLISSVRHALLLQTELLRFLTVLLPTEAAILTDLAPVICGTCLLVLDRFIPPTVDLQDPRFLMSWLVRWPLLETNPLTSDNSSHQTAFLHVLVAAWTLLSGLVEQRLFDGSRAELDPITMRVLRLLIWPRTLASPCAIDDLLALVLRSICQQLPDPFADLAEFAWQLVPVLSRILTGTPSALLQVTLLEVLQGCMIATPGLRRVLPLELVSVLRANQSPVGSLGWERHRVLSHHSVAVLRLLMSSLLPHAAELLSTAVLTDPSEGHSASWECLLPQDALVCGAIHQAAHSLSLVVFAPHPTADSTPHTMTASSPFRTVESGRDWLVSLKPTDLASHFVAFDALLRWFLPFPDRGLLTWLSIVLRAYLVSVAVSPTQRVTSSKAAASSRPAAPAVASSDKLPLIAAVLDLVLETLQYTDGYVLDTVRPSIVQLIQLPWTAQQPHDSLRHDACHRSLCLTASWLPVDHRDVGVSIFTQALQSRQPSLRARAMDLLPSFLSRLDVSDQPRLVRTFMAQLKGMLTDSSSLSTSLVTCFGSLGCVLFHDNSDHAFSAWLSASTVPSSQWPSPSPFCGATLLRLKRLGASSAMSLSDTGFLSPVCHFTACLCAFCVFACVRGWVGALERIRVS